MESIFGKKYYTRKTRPIFESEYNYKINKMRPVFENKYDDPFDNMMDTTPKYKSNNMLAKYITKKLNNHTGKTGFMWQMQGNQIKSTIIDIIDRLVPETNYVCINRYFSIYDVVHAKDSMGEMNGHIYKSEDDAMDDNTRGVIIFNEFSRANMPLVDFAISLISGESDYHVAKNWAIIMLGNREDGEDFWKPEYNNLFECVEYTPSNEFGEDIDNDNYDEDDEDDENLKGEDDEDDNDNFSAFNESETSDGYNFKNSSIDDIKDKIYRIIYNEIKNGEITRDSYVYIDTNGISIGNYDEFDEDSISFAKPADMLIDFDAVDRGNIIIYTPALMTFIEDSIQN